MDGARINAGSEPLTLILAAGEVSEEFFGPAFRIPPRTLPPRLTAVPAGVLIWAVLVSLDNVEMPKRDGVERARIKADPQAGF